MKLKKLKINGSTYDIKLDPKLTGKNLGLIKYIDQQILVETTHKDKISTVLHEAIHAITFDYSLEPSMGKDPKEYERTVELLSNGVISLLRNNPEFVKEIMKGR